MDATGQPCKPSSDFKNPGSNINVIMKERNFRINYLKGMNPCQPDKPLPSDYKINKAFDCDPTKKKICPIPETKVNTTPENEALPIETTKIWGSFTSPLNAKVVAEQIKSRLLKLSYIL